jgi:hypothetical protein
MRIKGLTGRTGLLVSTALCALTGLTPADAQSVARLPFPEGYRSWFHVKSATTNEGNPAFATFGGIHHIYANPPALKGFESGNFPDGSVIVFDLLEFTEKPNKTTAEGARRHIDVMAKDSTRFKESGGWEFEEFRGENRTQGSLSPEAAKVCATCHAKQKEQGGVFSKVRP